jgi:asparagine synthetase B (glutamine-hydrolysing)
LSINGNQPFHHSTDDYDYMLICNGEIYNCNELADAYDIEVQSTSDCEVLLPLFISLKEDFSRFNHLIHGEYALVIIKKHRKTEQIQFFASTDSYSVRPLFWARDEDKIYFSSLLSGISPFSTNVQRLGGGEQIIGSFLFSENNNSISKSGLIQNIYMEKNKNKPFKMMS